MTHETVSAENAAMLLTDHQVGTIDWVNRIRDDGCLWRTWISGLRTDVLLRRNLLGKAERWPDI